MISNHAGGADRRHLILLALAIAFSTIVACEDDPSRPDDPTPDVVSAVVVDTAGPITRWLRIELEDAGSVEVYYEPIDGGRTFRMQSEAEAESHEIYLPRLLADTTYRYAIRTFAGTDVSDSIARGEFVTGSLPANLASLDIDVEGEASFELLIIGQGQGATSGSFGGQLAIETDGRVVWYVSSPGFPLAAQKIPNSHDIAYLDNGLQGIVRVRPDGRIRALLPTVGGAFGAVHHDIAPLDSARILYIQRDTQTVGDQIITGEGLYTWNTETGAIEHVWNVFDFLDWNTDRSPASHPSNWLHANALSIGPRGNIVMSLHRIDQVISIAPDFQSLEWRIGGPNATHPLAPEDVFIGQHSTFEVAEDRLLLFDNVGGGDFSRALELQIDADTAYAVWEYVPEPPITAELRSGAYRLDNGNSIVSFSVVPLTIDEVDANGVRVWRFIGSNMSAAFRAVPFESLAGEVRVDAMP